MNNLLELLEKYDCHLKRGEKSMRDFLYDNFNNYISDVKNSINPKDNLDLGQTMCEMVSEKIVEIEKNANELVEVLDLYNKGKIIPSAEKAFKVFEKMKPQLMQRYSKSYRIESYYRIREIKENKLFDLEKKELFHIPYTKNHLVRTERYSMPGHPCLYLASEEWICWYECHKPKRYALSEFRMLQPETNIFKFIDFSEKLKPLKYSFLSWFNNEKDIEVVRKYFLKYICTYPLRAACSVVVEHTGAAFVEEYIIPQFLLQWVLADENFDGIIYESCSSEEEVKNRGGYNAVLVTSNFDDNGYDMELLGKFEISKPSIVDRNKFF